MALNALVGKPHSDTKVLCLQKACFTDRQYRAKEEDKIYKSFSTFSALPTTANNSHADVHEEFNDDWGGELLCKETPVLEVGSLVRYVKDDHVEILLIRI